MENQEVPGSIAVSLRRLVGILIRWISLKSSKV